MLNITDVEINALLHICRGIQPSSRVLQRLHHRGLISWDRRTWCVTPQGSGYVDAYEEYSQLCWDLCNNAYIGCIDNTSVIARDRVEELTELLNNLF